MAFSPKLDNWSYIPGENEPIRLDVVWRVDGNDHTTVTDLPRAPLPMGFRARAGSDNVTLSWDPIRPLPDYWLTGPEFVVLRLESSQFRFGYIAADGDKLRCLLPTAEPREVFVGDASVLTWTDRDIEVGKTYVYGLLVRGTMKVVTTYGDAEPVVTPVPMEVAAPPHRWDRDEIFLTDWRCTRVATPEPARPVRLAVFQSEEHDPFLAVNVQQLTTALGGRKDMDIVERGIASNLLSEQDLAAMGGVGLRPVAAADLLLDVRLRSTAHAVFRDTWLHDFLNADSRRIASADAGKPVGGDELAAIEMAVRTAFPNLAPRPVPTGHDQTTGTVAMAPLALLGGAVDPDATALADLLTVALQDAGLPVVDRERLQAASRELEVGTTAEQAMALGRLVGADFFVTGEWGMLGNAECRGRFRLIRTADGLQVSTCEAAAQDVQQLATAVAERFAAAATDTMAARPVGVMHRLLEARALYRARDARRLAKEARRPWLRKEPDDKQAAALVAPEDGASLAETAHFYLSRNQSDRAVDFLRNRLAKVGKTGSFWEAAEPLAGVLRARGDTTSEALLWQDLLAKTDPGDFNYGCMALLLAETLVAQERNDEAMTWLEKVVPPPGETGREDYRMYRKGRLLERMGLIEQAAQAYVDAWRVFDGPQYAMDLRTFSRPSLSALIRLLTDPDKRAAHAVVLREIVHWRFFPQQAALAAQELLEGGCDDREALWCGALACAAVGDDEHAKAAVLRLLTRGTGGVGRRYQQGPFVFDQSLSARIRSLGSALGPAAFADTPIPEGEARALVEAAFRDAPKLVPAPVLDRATPGEFYDPYWVQSQLKGLKSDEALYVVGHRKVWALQANGTPVGQVLWQRDLPPGRGKGLPRERYQTQHVEDGVIVVTLEPLGDIRAYDALTGDEKWHHLAWTQVSGALVRQGRAYVNTLAGDLLVLDLTTGQLIQRVSHPLASEVFRPALYPPQFDPKTGSLLAPGRPWLTYELGDRIVACVGELPDRATARPSLLDGFCQNGVLTRENAAVRPQAEPDPLAPLMAELLDQQKSERERIAVLGDIRNRLVQLPDSPDMRELRRLVTDRNQPRSLRRCVFGLLANLPGNTEACLAMALLDDDRDFVEPALAVMARESDAAWVAAVQKVRTRSEINWNANQRTEDVIRKENLARTARTGFLAPEIGWDRSAVDQAIAEHLASLKRVHPRSETFWYEVADRTNSPHLPRLRDIVYGQVGDQRAEPIRVAAGEAWTGTDREAEDLLQCMAETQPRADSIPLLAALLTASDTMRDWAYRQTRSLSSQQLLRIGTDEAIRLVLAKDDPFTTAPDDIDRGMDLLEQACGHSFRTLDEWRLWWGRQTKDGHDAK